MPENKDFGNTMEINSIIEEARKLNSTETKKADEDLYTNNKPTIEDTGFIDINDDYEESSFDYNYDYDEPDRFVYKDKANRKKPSKRQNSPQKIKNKKSKKPLIITLSIIGGLILICGIGFLIWYFFLSASTDTFANNIYVNDISITGLTTEQAKEKLKQEENKIADDISITVKAEKKSVKFDKSCFEYSFNTDEILKEAMDYSQERGFKTEEKKYTIIAKLDDNNTDSLAKKVAKKVNQKAKNAIVTEFDTSDVTFSFKDEQTGIKVDQKELSSQLKKFIDEGNYKGDIDAKTEIVEPKYTADYLKKNITKLSEFSTYSTNGENGNHNMATALNACNGFICNPNEVFSFNECTGDSNKESNGYLPAGVIVEGRHETGIGGGICQASTTIYNAACLAGMSVVERACHYYQSSYVDAGRDATIDYGNIDLKLQNVFDYQLMLKCYMEGTTLYAEIYGIPNEKFDSIEIDAEVVSSFDNGFKAETTRTYLKDGDVVDSDKLPDSTYYTSAPASASNDDNASYQDTNDYDAADEGNGEDTGTDTGDDGGEEVPIDDQGDGGEEEVPLE